MLVSECLVCSRTYLTYPFQVNYVLCILEARYREYGRKKYFWYMSYELGPKLKTVILRKIRNFWACTA